MARFFLGVSSTKNRLSRVTSLRLTIQILCTIAWILMVTPSVKFNVGLVCIVKLKWPEEISTLIYNIIKKKKKKNPLNAYFQIVCFRNSEIYVSSFNNITKYHRTSMQYSFSFWKKTNKKLKLMPWEKNNRGSRILNDEY